MKPDEEKTKECRTCSLLRLGCGCDGSFDAGCWFCTPDKFSRPSCECEKSKDFSHPEHPGNYGFRGMMRHPDGEQYSCLVKGTRDIRVAATSFAREESAHNVTCVSIFRWVRSAVPQPPDEKEIPHETQA